MHITLDKLYYKTNNWLASIISNYQFHDEYNIQFFGYNLISWILQ